MTAAIVGALAAPAAAAPQPQPYRANDAGGFRNVLPPGTNGLANIARAGCLPGHRRTPAPQRRPVRALPRPALRRAAGSTRPASGASSRTPASACAAATPSAPTARGADVTIVRDRGYGVPHIYADSRAAALWAVGYVSAEDRLFFMDIFRHLGRGRLSQLAGGAPANRAFDQLVWKLAPYTEDDLQRQIGSRPRGYERESDELRADLAQYVAGINAYIREARLNPLKMPGEYAAVNRPQGPDGLEGDRRGGHGGGDRRDLRRGRRPGGRFRPGAGGGAQALRAQAGREGVARLPPGRRPGVAEDRAQGAVPVRAAAAQAAPGRRFPTPGPRASRRSWPRAARGRRRRLARARRAGLPQGSVERAPRLRARVRLGASAGGLRAPDRLLLTAGADGDGRARAGDRRARRGVPGGEPVRADRPRARLRLERHHVRAGHRRHLRPAPVRAGGRAPHGQLDALPASAAAACRSRCSSGPTSGSPTSRTRPRPAARPSAPSAPRWGWSRRGPRSAAAPTSTRACAPPTARSPTAGSPSAGSRSPAGCAARATSSGSSSLVPFTFNWFYVDRRHIAYQNSGANPVRARGTDASLPILGKRRNEWRGWDPGTNVAPYTVPRAPPERGRPALHRGLERQAGARLSAPPTTTGPTGAPTAARCSTSGWRPGSRDAAR